VRWFVPRCDEAVVGAGHDVTLLGSGDSRTKAERAAVYKVAQSHEIGGAQVEIRHALSCYERAGDFDVISEHSGPPAAVIGGAVDTPVVHTVHGPLNGEPGDLYDSIAKVSPSTGLVSISMNQRKPRPNLPWIANIPNALDFSVYPFARHRGDYLLFLGRFSPDKGAHRALAIAMETGLPLKLVGKRREPAEEQYFAEFIEPHLRPGHIE